MRFQKYPDKCGRGLFIDSNILTESKMNAAYLILSIAKVSKRITNLLHRISMQLSSVHYGLKKNLETDSNQRFVVSQASRFHYEDNICFLQKYQITLQN